MKKFFIKIIFLLIAAGFFISCGAQVSKIETLVPEDAIFFMQVKNPEGLFTDIDSFLVSTQFNMFTGSKNTKSILADAVAGSGLNLEQIDTTQPLGMAMMMSGGFAAEPEPIVFIPMVNPDSDIKSLESTLAPLSIIVKRVDNYAILITSSEIAESYPLSTHLDLSSLSKYEDNSITAFINMKSIMVKFGPMITGGLGMVKSMLGPEMYGADSDPATIALLSKFIDMYFAFIEKFIDIAKYINDLSYSAAVNAMGVQIKSSSSVMEGNYVADFINAAGTNSDIKDYAKYLPDNYMFSGIGNMNPEAMRMLGIGMLDILTEVSIFDEADINELIQASNKLYDAMGSKTAFAMDFKIDMSLLTDMSDLATLQDPADINSILGEAFSFDMIAVYELTDPDLFRNTMEDIVNGGLVSKIINSIYRDLGMKFSASYRDKVVENGFEYDILSYDIDISDFFAGMFDDGSLEAKFQMQMMSMIIDVLMEKFKYYLHFTDTQCFMTMSNDGLGLLKSLVDKDSYTGGNMAESAVFKDVFTDIPAVSNYIFQFSVTNLMDLVVSALSGGQINSLNITDTTGLIGYGRFADNTIEGTIEYPAAEIAGFISNMGVLMSLGM